MADVKATVHDGRIVTSDDGTDEWVCDDDCGACASELRSLRSHAWFHADLGCVICYQHTYARPYDHQPDPNEALTEASTGGGS